MKKHTRLQKELLNLKKNLFEIEKNRLSGAKTYSISETNKKYQTVIPMSPKTHILSMNAYELEILRLLHLFAPENPVVAEMIKTRLEHLKKYVCFGGECTAGECFHATLPTIRFINTVTSDEKKWMQKLATKINDHIDWKYKENSVNYYLLCLSELPYDIAEPGLLKYKDEIRTRMEKSASMNTERTKTYQPVLYYIYRNCLSRFPEYEYIKNREPYINEKDGRLYFDMSNKLPERKNLRLKSFDYSSNGTYF